MPVKPSENEEEYFAKQELELRRKLSKEYQNALAAEERERLRTQHFMHCPKCGLKLEEVAFGDVRVDKCFGCGGMWLDHGEIERMETKAPGFIDKVLKAFGT